ncbi:MAG: hypothetical protein RSA91_01070 [Bacilli bacterium]
MEEVLLQDQLTGLISTTTGNLTLIDTESGVQLYSNTLQDIGIDVKEDNKKIQGGIGNPVIYSWGENRQITVSISDAVSKLNWTAAKLGQELKKGKVLAFKEAKTYVVSKSLVKLDVVPAPDVTLKIFDLEKGNLIDKSKFTLADGTITFSDSTIADGSKVYINGYNIEVNDAIFVDIDSNKFAKTFEVVITNPIVTIKDGKPSTKFMRQYRFPLGRLSGDFKDDMKSKSDGGKMDSKIEIMKPITDSKMGRIMVLPVSAFDSNELQSMGLLKKS